jgi:Ubiquitin family
MSTISLASQRFIVRPLDGENQVYEGLAADATVRDLKERIFVADGVAIENQKLIYGAEIMQGQPPFRVKSTIGS